MSSHFTIAYWCVLVVALMPIVCAGIAKGGMSGKSASEGGFDNVDPRAWLARQTAWRARANAAQSNCFEAMPFFIGAVIIAHQLGANPFWLNTLALAFVALRAAYVALYISAKASLRSMVWMAALTVNVVILFLGY